MAQFSTKTPFSCKRGELTICGHIYRADTTARDTLNSCENLATSSDKSGNAAVQQTTRKKPVIILSHGFLGNDEQTAPYAEALAKLGYIALTFDFNGGGPASTSSGKSIDMTVLTEKEDLLSVLKYAESLDDADMQNISLMGFSQGGFVSALVAAELKDRIKQLVLFFPALCIPDDARKGNMLIMSFDPNEVPAIICQEPMIIGRNYALTAQKLDPYKEISGFEGRTLIIHGTADDIVNIEYSRKAKKVYKNLVYKEIEGAGHGFTGKADEEAIRILTDFCK